MLRKPRAYKDDNIRVGPKSKGISGLAKSNEPLVSHKELENLLTSLVTISFSIQAHLHGFSSSYIMFYSKKKIQINEGAASSRNGGKSVSMQVTVFCNVTP